MVSDDVDGDDDDGDDHNDDDGDEDANRFLALESVSAKGQA